VFQGQESPTVTSKRLDGKRCLIVGGTSGIGLATAERFLREGARVAVAGLPGSDGWEVEKRLQALGPAAFFPCDVTKINQIDDQLMHWAVGNLNLGGLDVLFHVVGGSGRRFGDGPLHECSDEGWRQTIDLNLRSVFLTNRRAIQYFLEHKQPGVILNLASVLAFDPAPEHFDTVAYAAAKGGVIALSRYAAARYAADGIRVNVLAPGLIDTPMSARAVADPVIVDYLRRKQPLANGPGRPEDCADAAVFLCSDEARLLTGVVLPVDGGWCVSDGSGRLGN
jgi:NAD(P)-dependent dehydrogenase (short-subunit alcohol dehydrogenase family)